MKKFILNAMMILLGVSFCTFLSGEEISAQRLKTKKYRRVYVICDTTYKIDKVVKDVPGLAESIGKKKIKWYSSNKNLVVKKKKFQVRKAGKYRLIGKTKKYKYVLPIWATDKKRFTLEDIDVSKVSYAVIPDRTGQGNDVMITDYNEVGKLCAMIPSVVYKFNYSMSQKIKHGSGPYIILYAADNREIATIVPERIRPEDGWWCYVNSSNDLLNYIIELYSKYYDPKKTY